MSVYIYLSVMGRVCQDKNMPVQVSYRISWSSTSWVGISWNWVGITLHHNTASGSGGMHAHRKSLKFKVL